MPSLSVQQTRLSLATDCNLPSRFPTVGGERATPPYAACPKAYYVYGQPRFQMRSNGAKFRRSSQTIVMSTSAAEFWLGRIPHTQPSALEGQCCGRLWLIRTASVGDDAGETPSGLRWAGTVREDEQSDLRFSRCNMPEKSDAQGPKRVGYNAVRWIFTPELFLLLE
ncbi:hypothetical protein FKP32DRAFT_485083 [Trametes sanguinea]|nr:hypothetical protein FKP32DRAFT_485083 [Trametes sanguinea]